MTDKNSGTSVADEWDADVRAVRSIMSKEKNVFPELAADDSQEPPAKTQHLIDHVPSAIRNYHPERKAVLRTSFVLLLMLKPLMIWASVFLTCFLILLSYLYAGPDRFWRRVISIHQFCSRVAPSAAREVKLRAYVLAKRWDEMLLWMPNSIADELRTPDLRGIIRADKQHHRAMTDRLNRLT